MDYYDDSELEEEEVEEEPTGSEFDDDDDEDYGFEYTGDVDDDPSTRSPQAYYVILSESDILQRQADAVESVASVLSISSIDAGILLRQFKWSVSRVQEEWFQDEDHVRQSVGLLESKKGIEAGATELTCGICFETYARDDMMAPKCKEHFFCEVCWQGYIKNAITEGPGCLTLRCPDPACGAAVGEDMVLYLVSEEYRKKYMRYLLRSFVEDNRKAKWCPAPGCEFAVEYVPGSSSFDIVCKCGHNFCWNCLEEAHRPVGCETVEKWILKNSAESENMNWILANSKPCPKCKRPIEKNQGCMHMSCTPPCKFEFCWLCLGAWSEHGETTGGFYACNRYETAKNEGVYDESERRREMAKNSLERYTHYYERWATNESSRLTALDSQQQMQSSKIEVLSDKQCQPVSQLKFVIEAWQQVVECRRVLKWTYAYGFYLPENETAKRNFFEYLQGEAEAGLERLHNCAEKELETFLGEGPEKPIMSFNEFRTKLAGLTSVTHTYFENLVRALENGLQDVTNPKAPTILGKASNSKGFKGAKPNGRRGGGGRNSATIRGSTAGDHGGDDREVWLCERCTLANDLAAMHCAVCAQPRPTGC